MRLPDLFPAAAKAHHLAALPIHASLRAPDRNAVEAESEDGRAVAVFHAGAQASLHQCVVVILKRGVPMQV